MGIGNDDSTHELYLSSVFLDGVSGASYRGVGDAAEVGITHDATARMLPADRWQWRPAREVMAFAVMCDCSVPGGYARASTTVLTQWKRVYSPADEDFDLGRLYVALDQDTAGVSDRPEVEVQMRRHWSKHLAPQRTTRDLEEAWAQSRTALDALDAAVEASREAGLSWADVGRATGMSRQAARQRWGSGAVGVSCAPGGEDVGG